MKTALISVCSEEYLTRYNVLYTSLLKHIPNATPLLYFGGKNNPTQFGDVINVNHLVQSSKYTNILYTYCSIRVKSILDAFSRGYDKVILLGADTEFFDYPKECVQSLDNNEMFVTMYIHEPYEGSQDLYGNDHQVLINGQIQADFVAFRNTPKIIKFLQWLDKKVETECLVNGVELIDQVWMSMCFSFLDKVYISRSLGNNVGHYNMFQRNMHLHNNEWFMKDNSKLILFHYAGFIKNEEERISKHQNRYLAIGDHLQFLKAYGSKL